jgi:epoxide hydrolase
VGMSRRRMLRSLVAGAAGLMTVTPGSPFVPDSRATPSRRRPLALDPFEIRFPPEAITDLHRRIDAMRWPEMPFETGWDSGTDIQVLRELTEYWREEYDWFSVEDELNRLQHLRGPIEGENLHCVLYEGEGSAPRTPLLLLHGWPSTFLEFTEAAPGLLSASSGRSGFDLVVPSLPGFGFSDPPSQPGMNIGRIADRLHLLMLELGYERYGVQGGDWGAIVGSQMARRHPESLVGLHVNFVAGAPLPPDGEPMSAEEVSYREARERFQAEETGYSSIQGTRPQSLAFAQHDSPVGWLAWMLEKYWAWSDHDGDLWSTFTRDQILTTAMLYWLPGRILSAARIYQEAFSGPPGSVLAGRIEVPTGYARFPAEPWGPPREVVERSHNLVHYSEHPQGGHFPALEQPVRWADDVGEFFRSLV